MAETSEARRVMPSSLDYEHLNELADEIARRVKNPQVWFDLREAATDSPEYRAGVQSLLNEQGALLSSGDVADQIDAILREA